MSESDELPNNVFAFQNGSTTVSARGPNINASNIGFSFRNVLPSNMPMPRNFEQQRYAESNYDQRSMYYRRDTSPMSIHSACDARVRNLHNSYYPGRMSSQRSIANGRSGSPMSFRSIDTNATSVSAADIAMALKNAKFNKYDLRVIKDAYNKFMKARVRKRIEKRRNLRLFLKGSRRRSDYDSGEQGSDSSISSDDCRSIKTTGFKESMSSCRSTKTDLTCFRKTIQGSNMYKDCTENVRQNTFRNIVTVGNENSNNSNLQNRAQTLPTIAQKDRFKNGFLLPSQRFNRSVAASAIPENMEGKDTTRPNLEVQNQSKRHAASAICDTDSEQEEIFANTKDNTTSNIKTHRKRRIDSDEIGLPEQKRSKLSPIYKKNIETNIMKCSQPKVNTVSHNSDFIFAKPSFPLKKSANVKITEKLISKSSQPLLDSTMSKHISNTQPSTSDQKEDRVYDALPITRQSSISDVSMRPSFIKRKLFTQKLDVTEKKNVSCDSVAANSPHSKVYSTIQNEKNKARKLVTQSCLRRDDQDDNNLMDLIHKIVPPDHMNATNKTNKTEVHTEQNNLEDLDHKWDVTSIISTCNIDNVSDTYTDEEILEEGNNSNKTKDNVSMQLIHNAKVSQFKVLLEKLPENVSRECLSGKSAMDSNYFKKKHVEIKSFWDTDFDSEFECHNEPHLNSNLKENYNKANNIKGAAVRHIKNNNNENKIPSISDSTNLTNDTVFSQKLNITNLKIRSHRAPKRKKCCTDLPKPTEKKAAVFEPPIKKQTSKQNLKNATKSNNNTLNKSTASDSTLNVTKIGDTEAVHHNNNKRKTNTKTKTNALSEKDSAVSSIRNKNEEKGPENKKNKKITKNIPKANNISNISCGANSIVSTNFSETDDNIRKQKALDKMKSNNLSNKSNEDSTFDTTKDVSSEINVSVRPLRSCRTSKSKTLDASKINQSMNNLCNSLSKSLRSRQIDLSSCFNKEKDIRKGIQNLSTNNSRVSNKTIQAKSRQSDVSFSLVSNKKSGLVNKKTINKTELNKCNKEIEMSDVSFSLNADKESPLSTISLNKGKAKLAKIGKNTIMLDHSNKCLLNKRQISEVSVQISRGIIHNKK